MHVRALRKQYPHQIPRNGIDDDRNGYIDDVHGYNFLTNSGDPMDNNFHGTHLSGALLAALAALSACCGASGLWSLHV